MSNSYKDTQYKDTQTEILSMDSSNDNQNYVINKDENELGFTADLMIDQKQLKTIGQTSLSLTKRQVFTKPNLFQQVKNTLSRKNEILYCISTKELSVDISDVSGQVYLPLLTKEEISSKLNILNRELRRKINMVHIGAVKILIKAQYRNGINTPIKMALVDNRINSRKDCILGTAKGNLAYGKFMFTVYPKFGLSLNSASINQTLSFVHEFERKDLMNKGDKVFSITYLVGYALTNSHHSIDYKDNPNIELDDVFQDIGEVQGSQFAEIDNEPSSWAINIAKNKPPLHKARSSTSTIEKNFLRIGTSSDHLLRSVSERVDTLGKRLEDLIIENHYEG